MLKSMSSARGAAANVAPDQGGATAAVRAAAAGAAPDAGGATAAATGAATAVAAGVAGHDGEPAPAPPGPPLSAEKLSRADRGLMLVLRAVGAATKHKAAVRLLCMLVLLVAAGLAGFAAAGGKIGGGGGGGGDDGGDDGDDDDDGDGDGPVPAPTPPEGVPIYVINLTERNATTLTSRYCLPPACLCPPGHLQCTLFAIAGGALWMCLGCCLMAVCCGSHGRGFFVGERDADDEYAGATTAERVCVGGFLALLDFGERVRKEGRVARRAFWSDRDERKDYYSDDRKAAPHMTRDPPPKFFSLAR